MGLVLGGGCDHPGRWFGAFGAPAGIAGSENRRVKNDQEDARLLADLLRMGRLPRRGSRQSRFVINANWSATDASCHNCEPVSRHRSMPCWAKKACYSP